LSWVTSRNPGRSKNGKETKYKGKGDFFAQPRRIIKKLVGKVKEGEKRKNRKTVKMAFKGIKISPSAFFFRGSQKACWKWPIIHEVRKERGGRTTQEEESQKIVL